MGRAFQLSQIWHWVYNLPNHLNHAFRNRICSDDNDSRLAGLLVDMLSSGCTVNAEYFGSFVLADRDSRVCRSIAG